MNITMILPRNQVRTKASTDQARQKAFKRSLDELIGKGKVFKQKIENGTELVLRTDDGHTHPPL